MSDTLAPKFPAVAYELRKGDDRFDQGGRFKLEQLDGDCFVFKTKPSLDRFVTMHGYELISSKTMKLRRLEYDQSRDIKDSGDAGGSESCS